jgi:hypothetical protein
MARCPNSDHFTQPPVPTTQHQQPISLQNSGCARENKNTLFAHARSALLRGKIKNFLGPPEPLVDQINLTKNPASKLAGKSVDPRRKLAIKKKKTAGPSRHTANNKTRKDINGNKNSKTGLV